MQVKPIVEDVIKLLRSTLPRTIDIQTRFDKNIRNINGNSTEIHQIIMNLCTNTVHAMDDNEGLLEIRLNQVYLDSLETGIFKNSLLGNYIKISVSYTGHEMEQKIIDSIFEPYFTIKEKGKRTELSLSVVNSIVKNHKGEINVYSEPQVLFYIYSVYSLVIHDDIQAEIKDIGKAPRGNEHILFVDDEQVLVNIGKLSLKKLGYIVLRPRLTALKPLSYSELVHINLTWL